MRAAAVQLTSGPDKEVNLTTAARLIGRAAGDGADLVVLPEMFNLLGPGSVLRAGAEPLDGPTSAWAAEQARDHGIWLVAGTFIERDADGSDGVTGGDGRNHNTCCVYAPDGRRVATYRKIHLFDVDVPGAEYHESEVIAPGTEVVVTDELRAPAGDGRGGGQGGGRVGGRPLPLGLSICYDVRFPELYRIAALAGARIVSVPAAFTATTGPPHWEVLLRARAIENQVFVVAAGQCGTTTDKLRWHGHSMIVDPWGTVLAHADDRAAGAGATAEPGAPGTVIVADLDLDDQERIRGVLPSLANRRPEAYRWPS